MQKKLLIAGHRDIEEDIVAPICSTALKRMKNYSTLITGMAMGVDIVSAEICLAESDWNVIAAIPFYGQEAKWDTIWRKRYYSILSNSRVRIENVTEGPYDPKCLFRRNGWMVRKCDAAVLFMHNDKSGTGHTFRMLEEAEKKFWVYDPVAKLWR